MRNILPLLHRPLTRGLLVGSDIVSDVVNPPNPPIADGPFARAAQRILTINAAPKTLTRTSAPAASGGVDITIYQGVSTIDPETDSTAGGGAVARGDIPDGYAGPIQPDNNWIIGASVNPYFDPEDQLQEDGTGGLTYAPGNSKLFLFDGLEFEFLPGAQGANSVGINWSEDNGLTWKQAPLFVWDDAQRGFIKFTFPDARARVVELIGGDQTPQIYGANFGAGADNIAPLPFIDTTTPRGMMFGDSFMFGQGANDFGNGLFVGVNAQNGLRGLPRQFGEKLGSLWVYPHGLRGAAWTDKGKDTPVNHTKMAERLTCVYPEWSEGSRWGALDYIVMASTVNDSAVYQQSFIRADVTAGLLAARAEQPNAIILLCIGANAPQNNEGDTWLDGYKDGFMDAFGTMPAEWAANGAYMHDGSRRDGANWTPAGGEGSSPYFGAPALYPGADRGHPTAAGHAHLAEKYVEGLILGAQAIVSATPVLQPPANSSAPVLVGDTAVGSTLTIASPGTWTGNPAPVITRQWQRNSADIPGQTGTAYTTDTADVGSAVTLLETATNSEGSVTRSSNFIIVTAASALATWDSSLRPDLLTYSANDTQVNNTDGSTRYAKSTEMQSSGKRFFEIEVNQGAADFGGLGAPGSGHTGGSPGTLRCGWLLGKVRYSNSGSDPMGTNADTIGVFSVAVDIDNDLMWIKGDNGDWNNNPAADPAGGGVGGVDISGMGGTVGPMVGLAAGAANGAVLRLSGGPGTAVPDGFIPWATSA